MTVVGNDNGLVVIGFGSLDNFLHAMVNSPDGLSDGIINTGMSHHIAVGEVHHDEIVLLSINSAYQFVFYFIG